MPDGMTVQGYEGSDAQVVTEEEVNRRRAANERKRAVASPRARRPAPAADPTRGRLRRTPAERCAQTPSCLTRSTQSPTPTPPWTSTRPRPSQPPTSTTSSPNPRAPVTASSTSTTSSRRSNATTATHSRRDHTRQTPVGPPTSRRAPSRPGRAATVGPALVQADSRSRAGRPHGRRSAWWPSSGCARGRRSAVTGTPHAATAPAHPSRVNRPLTGAGLTSAAAESAQHAVADRSAVPASLSVKPESGRAQRRPHARAVATRRLVRASSNAPGPSGPAAPTLPPPPSMLLTRPASPRRASQHLRRRTRRKRRRRTPRRPRPATPPPRAPRLRSGQTAPSGPVTRPTPDRKRDPVIKTLLRHLRSQAVAYIALFVALGGTSYAALSLPAGSVGTRQLRSGAVTGTKLAKGAVTRGQPELEHARGPHRAVGADTG